jgi:cytochrome c-type biogenesis protein
MAGELAWLELIAEASPLAFAFVALAGLAMGVAPSSLPLISVAVGLVAGQGSEAGARFRLGGLTLSGSFVLGIATVDAAVGALFGFLGMIVIQTLIGYLALTNLVLAALLVVFGLALLRIIRVPLPVLRPSPRPARSFAGAYGLGIPFGLSACPACTPMILPILGAAAATGEPGLGAALLFVFGLARGIPIVIAGVATGTVTHIRSLVPWVPRIERAAGALLLLAALYFLYASAMYAGLVPVLPFIR